MKTTNKLFAALLMVLFFAGCGSTSNAYYPLEELNSTGINKEALSYFKGQILASNALECERVAIHIGSRDGIVYVYAYALDETGLFERSYPIEGEMVNDIIESFQLDEYSFPQTYYTYEMYVSYLESEDGILVANRAVDEKMLQCGAFNSVKNQLVEAGYPERDFSVINGTLYYGKFMMFGDAKQDLMNILYGMPGNIGKYSFSDSRGVLFTTTVG